MAASSLDEACKHVYALMIELGADECEAECIINADSIERALEIDPEGRELRYLAESWAELATIKPNDEAYYDRVYYARY